MDHYLSFLPIESLHLCQHTGKSLDCLCLWWKMCWEELFRLNYAECCSAVRLPSFQRPVYMILEWSQGLRLKGSGPSREVFFLEYIRSSKPDWDFCHRRDRGWVTYPYTSLIPPLPSWALSLKLDERCDSNFLAVVQSSRSFRLDFQSYLYIMRLLIDFKKIKGVFNYKGRIRLRLKVAIFVTSDRRFPHYFLWAGYI